MKILAFLLTTTLLFSETRQEAIDALPVDSSQTSAAWHRLGMHDHRGVDLPLLSIVSKNSSGNGEFLDLIPVIDWLSKNNLDLLQLLPLNDTGDMASPYSPLSFDALHPIYLSLEHLPFLNESSSLKKELQKFKPYNKTPRVDFHTVLKEKLLWLENYVKEFSAQLQARPFYQDFLSKTTGWLDSYALYKVLRKKYGDLWEEWPKNLQTPNTTFFDEFIRKYKNEMLFHKVVQSLCFEQMEYVHRYANQNGVFILGDMTYLIDHNSYEAWHHSDAFKLNFSAGTPPDIFQTEGQYWGLPPYNWEAIKKDRMFLVLNRVKTFSWIYDMFRLDFCNGYFSQYEIPQGESPTKGKFVPESIKQAVNNGKQILTEMTKVSSMLPVAEDLGMAPAFKDVLIKLGISGWHLFVFINSNNDIANQTLPGENASLLSVSQLSNHDTPPLRLWWKENPDRAKAIAAKNEWSYAAELTLEQQQQLLWEDLHSRSLFHIELLQDILPPHLTKAVDELRINYPGTFSDINWTYRYNLSVEELLDNPETAEMIHTVLSPTPPLKLPHEHPIEVELKH